MRGYVRWPKCRNAIEKVAQRIETPILEGVLMISCRQKLGIG